MALDSARALLMLLGLWVHSAAPYRDRLRWVVDDPAEGLAWLGASSEWLVAFRMPAFFLLAGVLAAWALQKRGPLDFLCRRSWRLIVPLACGALSLNVIQSMLLARYASAGCATASACPVNLSGAIWLGHLWFLLDLMTYTLVLVIAWPLLSGLRPLIARMTSRRSLRAVTVLPVALGLSVAAYILWKLAIGLTTIALPALREPLLGFWSFTWVVDHAFFFALGVVLAFAPIFRDWLSSPIPLAVPIVLGCVGTFTQAAVSAAELTRNTLAEKVLFAAASAVPVVLLVAFAISAILCLHRWIARFLSAAARWSYSIYLVHHLVAVAVSLLLLPLAWPTALKFSTVLLSVIAVSVGAAILIERAAILRLLLNGESMREPVVASGLAAGSDRPGVAPFDLPGLATHPDARILLGAADADAPPNAGSGRTIEGTPSVRRVS